MEDRNTTYKVLNEREELVDRDKDGTKLEIVIYGIGIVALEEVKIKRQPRYQSAIGHLLLIQIA